MNRALLVLAAVAAPRRMAVVRKTAPPLLVIYVAGAVSHPGLLRLADGSRVADAVDRAGGFAPGADPAGVNLASPLSDGDEVVALKLGDRILHTRTQSRSSARRAPSKRKRKTPLAAIVRIDLNVADEAALGRIPGIGQRLA
ncbi:MAG: SLBB domain-containing protein [Candidatus Eremiobacteraeota bacterium]|nr:SLBB domain-containing protein [Candidatus Eremiobacteraeota bacterium]